jgi:hypothetical protein
MQNNIFNNFYDRYNTKTAVPAWFGVMFRTALTKNITTDVWNELIKNTQMLASDSENTLQFVQELSKAFEDGSIAQELSILKNGTPVSIQKWFDNHLEWFPDVSNITYTSTSNANKIPYDTVLGTVDETVDPPEVWNAPGSSFETDNKLQDDDIETVVVNPKYYETTQEITHFIKFVPETAFVSKVLIYSKRLKPIEDDVTVAKYTVSYYSKTLKKEVDWGTVSGFITPQIIDIYDECDYIKLSVKIDEASSERLPIYEVDILGYEATGYYTFEFTNGDSVRVNTCDMHKVLGEISSIVTECEGYKIRSEECAEAAEKWAVGTTDIQDETYGNSAKDWAMKASAQADTEGGFPSLIKIGDDLKIPSKYIQQVDVKSYIPVLDEDGLSTIDAQEGDVAVLLKTDSETGKQSVENSWILLKIEDGKRTWAVYGTSYATNAGHALEADTATKAGDASKISGLTVTGVLTEAEFEAVGASDRLGIYFVTIEGDSNA